MFKTDRYKKNSNDGGEADIRRAKLPTDWNHCKAIIALTYCGLHERVEKETAL